MRIVTAAAMREAERRTMEQYGIPGRLLMETAGRACADVVVDEFGHGGGRSAAIVAGKGNNGGDGYVIARCLRRSGWNARVFVLAERSRISGDALTNLLLLEPSDLVFCPSQEGLASLASALDRASVVVDALFGIGLVKEVSGIHAEAIRLMNGSGKPVLSVDLPSGIDAASGRVLGVAVEADITVTFAFGKMGHVLYPGREHTGKLVIADIGLPEVVTAATETRQFLDPVTIRPLVRRRDRRGHKGSYGHCLIIAGSTGKTGAASLAANSAVRTGSGLVTLAVPASLNPILETKTTEAMTLPLADAGVGFLGERNLDAVLMALRGKDSVALGPGISREADTGALVRMLLRECDLPMVVDADGLNAIADDVSILLEKKPRTLVLTPHPGEMSRLTGLTIDDIERDRVAAAREFALRYRAYLILKGADTVIASPEGEIAVNGSGNPGMASGGMGDVLTGILASLLGQRYHAMEACMVGVFIHGLAADMVAAEKGETGINATDVQERIPFAYKKLTEYGQP
jgi:NAD(P)H-hydrate epimerase